MKNYRDCPRCKGSGNMTLTNLTPGAESEFLFFCFECGGTAKISPETLGRMKREAAIWCSCDEPDFEGALFFDDGEHPETPLEVSGL
ncbi:MAG: hypothetical protein AAGN35_12380 [Bacteroidota bacterium]